MSNDSSTASAGRLLFVVNVSWFFISHRIELAKEAARSGYEVHVATGVSSDMDARTIREAGLVLHDTRIGRGGSRPIADLVAMCRLWKLMRALRPSIVHLVGIKPLLLGGIAARLARVPGVVMTVTGLGHGFIVTGVWSRLRRFVIRMILRFANGNTRGITIFQNAEDLRAFVHQQIVPADSARLIRGSGVDMEDFRPTDEEAGPLKVLLASRMLRTKGIPEFVMAAKHLRATWPEVHFLLAGRVDPENPASLTTAQLEAWNDQGIVRWLGHRDDLRALFASVHIVALPTYYKEGVPKVLIEAAASGRPVVTTDIPGCNDIVRHGVNGLLVPPQDPGKLAEAIDQLLRDKSLRREMGKRGRHIAEQEFALVQVISCTLRVYRDVIDGCASGNHAA